MGDKSGIEWTDATWNPTYGCTKVSPECAHCYIERTPSSNSSTQMLKLADHLKLPLDVVTEKLAWLGRTGSGKTYGAMKLAELMLDAGAQIGALDPVGVWRGLRVPAQKGSPSFDVVVFGGLYGDLPLQPTAGALIADVVCDRGISFVIDVSQFIPAEQQRFAKAFAERFFQRRKAAPAACHLFLEECQEFLPQNPMGLEADTLHEFQRLWKIGRNFGIGGSLISQRPQEINKKALNMSGTLFAFQMTAPQERKAVKEWVADHGVAEDIVASLQKLEVGCPHVESPMFLQVSKTVCILPRVTADLSSTPKVGSSKVATRPLTPIDVEQLKTAMVESIEKAKADDPRELRKRIAELTRQVQKNVHIPKTEDRDSAKPLLTDADRALLEKLGRTLEGMAHELGGASGAFLGGLEQRLEQVMSAVMEQARTEGERVHEAGRQTFAALLDGKRFQKIVATLQAHAPAPLPPRHTPVRAMSKTDSGGGVRPDARTVRPALRAVSAVSAVSGALAAPEARILNVLAWWEAAGIGAPSRHQTAFAARYSVNGHFNNILGGLRTHGLVDYPKGDHVSLTDAGRAMAARPSEPGTRDDLIEMARTVLRQEPQRRIFDAVVDAGSELTREDLAAACRYSVNGHFNNLLGSLRSLGLVRYPRGNHVALGEMFEALA